MKYILITGACGGMGSATSTLLSKKGYTVLALDKNACEPAENIIPIVADITNEDSIRLAFDKVREITDELAAIIHFAGRYMLDSLVEICPDVYDGIFNVNVRGAYLINKIFIPLLKKDSRIIITTSELSTLAPLPFTGIYAITKATLDKYAYSLHMELQLLGIKVSVLRAGAVETPMIEASTNALDKFCQNTKLYSFGAGRFREIVDSVESRKIPAIRIAEKAEKILVSKNPAFAYSVNRNPLLFILNMLPSRLQFFIIGQILKK